ncbi:MAG: hypothetical protein ACPGWR_18250, partial [Ardenticatenaceae bacterium]
PQRSEESLGRRGTPAGFFAALRGGALWAMTSALVVVERSKKNPHHSVRVFVFCAVSQKPAAIKILTFDL